MDDWEDVFRQAAGGHSTASPVALHPQQGTSVSKNNMESFFTPAKKKRRKRSNSVNRSTVNDGDIRPQLHLYASFLPSQEKDDQETKVASLHRHPFRSCRQYVGQIETFDASATATGSKDHHHPANQKHIYSTALCHQCAQPSGMHQLGKCDTSSLRNAAPDHALVLFIVVRNIRCYCRMELLLLSQSDQEEISSKMAFPSNLLSNLLLELRQFQSVVGDQHTTFGIVCNVALRQMNALLQHVEKMTLAAGATIKKQRRSQCIQCIMKCDEVYYRLYYNCLVAQTPSDPTNSSLAMPHPLTYFSEWVPLDQKRMNDADSNSGIFTDVTTCSMDSDENPLYRLFQHRQMETQAIFGTQEWLHASTCDSSRSLPGKASSCTFQSLFLEWNHSCRDFLCHLYCYATLSNSQMRQLLYHLKSSHNCTRIIEMGAGTGYLAHWLSLVSTTLDALEGALPTESGRRSPWHIAAYDIAPSRPKCSHGKKKKKAAMNEYHADMAGYYFDVQYGDVYSDSPIAQQRLSSPSDANTALLLCYPPPDSSMAYHALRNYCLHMTRARSSTQCVVIHIGEFKGLTGNEEFEYYLCGRFTCVKREPCILWGGVDAAELSIWTTGTTTTLPSSRSLLLPCSHCQEKESIRRCQFFRSLVYCSPACYLAHEAAMRQAKDARCRFLRDDAYAMLDFENALHFAVLPK